VTAFRDHIGAQVAYGGVMLRESCERGRDSIGARSVVDVQSKVRPCRVGSLDQALIEVDRTMTIQNNTYAAGSC